eukprot:Nk52_evm114s352 gene=Nk52_evmTU114s352
MASVLSPDFKSSGAATSRPNTTTKVVFFQFEKDSVQKILEKEGKLISWGSEKYGSPHTPMRATTAVSGPRQPKPPPSFQNSWCSRPFTSSVFSSKKYENILHNSHSTLRSWRGSMEQNQFPHIKEEKNWGTSPPRKTRDQALKEREDSPWVKEKTITLKDFCDDILTGYKTEISHLLSFDKKRSTFGSREKERTSGSYQNWSSSSPERKRKEYLPHTQRFKSPVLGQYRAKAHAPTNGITLAEQEDKGPVEPMPSKTQVVPCVKSKEEIMHEVTQELLLRPQTVQERFLGLPEMMVPASQADKNMEMIRKYGYGPRPHNEMTASTHKFLPAFCCSVTHDDKWIRFKELDSKLLQFRKNNQTWESIALTDIEFERVRELTELLEFKLLELDQRSLQLQENQDRLKNGLDEDTIQRKVERDRLLVFRDCFQAIVLEHKNYGPLLTAIKDEYDLFVDSLKMDSTDIYLLHSKYEELKNDHANRSLLKDMKEKYKGMKKLHKELVAEIQKLQDEMNSLQSRNVASLSGKLKESSFHSVCSVGFATNHLRIVFLTFHNEDEVSPEQDGRISGEGCEQGEHSGDSSDATSPTSGQMDETKGYGYQIERSPSMSVTNMFSLDGLVNDELKANRVEELQDEISDLIRTISDDKKERDNSYVPKKVYEWAISNNTDIERDIMDMEEECCQSRLYRIDMKYNTIIMNIEKEEKGEIAAYKTKLIERYRNPPSPGTQPPQDPRKDPSWSEKKNSIIKKREKEKEELRQLMAKEAQENAQFRELSETSLVSMPTNTTFEIDSNASVAKIEMEATSRVQILAPVAPESAEPTEGEAAGSAAHDDSSSEETPGAKGETSVGEQDVKV